jgi:hypothetical protein
MEKMPIYRPNSSSLLKGLASVISLIIEDVKNAFNSVHQDKIESNSNTLTTRGNVARRIGGKRSQPDKGYIEKCLEDENFRMPVEKCLEDENFRIPDQA